MNKFLDSARIALDAIWGAKLRSLMTVLGNIVAVTSIIAVVSLIQGLNASVKKAILNEAGADSFSVYRGTTPGGEGPTPIATGLTAPTYTDTALAFGTTYYYQVTATDLGGEGARSAEASSVPDVSEAAELSDSLSMAFLMVLESLTPTERAAFLLREVFGYEYGEIAELLNVSEPNARQLVHRAKDRVAERRQRFEADKEKQNEQNLSGLTR